MHVHVADHPLVSHKLTILRDEGTDSPTFRRLADELARIRGELERIIALHPETLAFLGPTLAGLPPAPAALPTSGHPFFGGPTGTQASTTNNVTVNVAAPVADPVLISKEITWALIP